MKIEQKWMKTEQKWMKTEHFEPRMSDHEIGENG
jgi:hypothetical protein